MKHLLFMVAIFVISSRLVLAQATEPLHDESNQKISKYYQLNGFKMYTEVYGSGPPLLMIHGNGGSTKAFTRNVPYFSRHYQVILADSRSQGKSLDPNPSLTFEMMADDFADLLDQMHIKSTDVIGWSDGGINALLLSIRHPEKVKHVVATGANLWPDADAFKPGVWDRDKIRYDADVHKKRETDAEKNAWKLFLLDWQEPHISLESLHTLSSPALIICGDHDLISLQHTLLIYQNIKHANLWVVPNSGHATLMEHSDEFNKKADEFFSMPFVDHQ